MAGGQRVGINMATFSPELQLVPSPPSQSYHHHPSPSPPPSTVRVPRSRINSVHKAANNKQPTTTMASPSNYGWASQQSNSASFPYRKRFKRTRSDFKTTPVVTTNSLFFQPPPTPSPRTASNHKQIHSVNDSPTKNAFGFASTSSTCFNLDLPPPLLAKPTLTSDFRFPQSPTALSSPENPESGSSSSSSSSRSTSSASDITHFSLSDYSTSSSSPSTPPLTPDSPPSKSHRPLPPPTLATPNAWFRNPPPPLLSPSPSKSNNSSPSKLSPTAACYEPMPGFRPLASPTTSPWTATSTMQVDQEEQDEEEEEDDDSLAKAEMLHRLAFEHLRRDLERDGEGFVERFRKWEEERRVVGLGLDVRTPSAKRGGKRRFGAVDEGYSVELRRSECEEMEEEEEEEEDEEDLESDDDDFEVVTIMPPCSPSAAGWYTSTASCEVGELTERLCFAAGCVDDYSVVRDFQRRRH
ncbi:hypothetical protein T439DRAFT_376386 [Meredithblackwellia eburnea MCA 4105]